MDVQKDNIVFNMKANYFDRTRIIRLPGGKQGFY